MASTAIVPFSPVPRDIKEWVQVRGKPKSYLDYIWDTHVSIMGNERYSEEYARYLDSTSKDDAVEGSVENDHIKAADMLREEAIRRGCTAVANTNLKKVKWGMRRMLWQYDMHVHSRRNKLNS